MTRTIKAVLFAVVVWEVLVDTSCGVHAPASFPQPSPIHRAAWMKEDGVIAASYMEPPSFILRRGGGSANAVQEWNAYHDEKILRKYKQAGINLIILNLHKGAGLLAERDDIEATRKLTEVAHRQGLKVGGYVGSSMMYETFSSKSRLPGTGYRWMSLGGPSTTSPTRRSATWRAVTILAIRRLSGRC